MSFFGLLIPPEDDDSSHHCDICKLTARRAVLAQIDFVGVPYWAHETCIVKLPARSVIVTEWARVPDPYHTEETPITASRRVKITEEQLACPT